MKCLRCNNQAKIPYPNGNLCHNCFLELLINRIKHVVKGKFERNDNVLVVGKLAAYFIKKTVKVPIKTRVAEKFSKKDYSKYDRIVVPITANDEAESFFDRITSKNLDFKENDKIIKLFILVLDTELEQAAKILKVKFKINSKNKILGKIHKRYPDSIFALAKSANEFKKAIK